MSTTVSEHVRDIEEIVLRASRRFDADVSTIRAHVAEIAAGFAHARIRSFVPILIERELRDRLRGGGFRSVARDPDLSELL